MRRAPQLTRQDEQLTIKKNSISLEKRNRNKLIRPECSILQYFETKYCCAREERANVRHDGER